MSIEPSWVWPSEEDAARLRAEGWLDDGSWLDLPDGALAMVREFVLCARAEFAWWVKDDDSYGTIQSVEIVARLLRKISRIAAEGVHDFEERLAALWRAPTEGPWADDLEFEQFAQEADQRALRALSVKNAMEEDQLEPTVGSGG
jgi:hypothetical protein